MRAVRLDALLDNAGVCGIVNDVKEGAQRRDARAAIGLLCMKKILIGVGIVLLTLGVLGGVKALQIGAMIKSGQSFQMPPTTVTSAEVERQIWPETIASVGTVSPERGAVLRAELPGRVVEIAFQSGADVEAGQVLVRLDTSTEQAQLKAAEATLELAKIEMERAESLKQSRTISASEFDAASAKFKEAEAQVENIRAVIARKTVSAPFPGRAGIRRVNVGSFVNAGDEIVSLQALDTVYLDFSLPQQAVSDLSEGMVVEAQVDAFPGKVFEGRLTAINPQLDERTRSLQVQATLPNPERLLQPGMFARVSVVKGVSNNVLAVPTTAILYAPYGNSVFVIEEAAKNNPDGEGQPGSTGAARSAEGLVIRQQFVRTGAARGDYIALEQGVEPGQRVVSTGVFKLRNGMPVVVDNSLAPKTSLDPKPSEG